jgi:hypothetical protein
VGTREKAIPREQSKPIALPIGGESI